MAGDAWLLIDLDLAVYDYPSRSYGRERPRSCIGVALLPTLVSSLR
jgi:hypothetical protein